MVKTSSITDHEAQLRLAKIDAVLNTLYYYFSEQDLDVWVHFCNVQTELKELIKEVKNDR